MSDNYELTDEQIMVKDTVHRMALEKIAPLSADIDESGELPQEVIEQFLNLGLFGLALPESYGGSEMGILTAAVALEEIGMQCSSSAAVCASPIAAGRIILEFGSGEQKSKYIPLLAAGETTAAIALSETEAESDIGRIATLAEKSGDQYIISGRKSFVELADKAGFIIVFARTKNEGDAGSASAFILEKDTTGWAIERNVKRMGTNAVSASELVFDNCAVPEENRLGQEGEGPAIAAKVLGLNCVVTAARALGIAQGAFDYSLNYTQERRQFGRPIAFFQGIQFMLADMATLVEAGRYLLYRGCAEIDRGEDGGYHTASMAKCFLSDSAMKVSTDAVQLLGGYGYIKDYPVERMMRDAKLTQLSEGTNRTRHLVLAEEMLRL